MKPIERVILGLVISSLIVLALVGIASLWSPHAEPSETPGDSNQYHSVIPTPEKDVVVP